MNILVDVGHPAHVHFFRNFIKEMNNRGHKIIVTHRRKEITENLLKYYDIKYIPTLEYSHKYWEKFYLNIKRAIIFNKLIKKYNVEVGVGIADYPLAWASKGTKCKALIFTDTEHVKIDKFFTYPFADKILTPSCFLNNLGSKQIRYDGYHELAYLHPNWFKPDINVLKDLGLNRDDKYVIIRFISWSASHDVGQRGTEYKEKIKLIKEIAEYAYPIITSEGLMPKELMQYQIQIHPHRIHDAMYYANLYIGEGGTMATESAIMGTPNILINPLAKYCGTHFDLTKRYKLQIFYDSISEVKDRAKKLILDKDSKKIWKKRRKKMLNEKIDVTRYIIDLIENYRGK
jgi:predicted glycosyltransferase